MNPNRNDLCPCGSGKKYKKCCMNVKVVAETTLVKEERFFRKKHELTEMVTAFLYSVLNYKEMTKLKKDALSRIDNAISQAYQDGWFRFYLSFFHTFPNGLRGVEWFYELNHHRLDSEKRSMLAEWTKLQSRFIQVVDYFESGVIVEDLHSKELLTVKYSDAFPNAAPWTGCICLLEKFEDVYFLNGVTILAGPNEMELALAKSHELMDQTGLSLSEIKQQYYPELLSVCLTGKSHPEHDRVSRIISEVTSFYTIKDKEKLVDFFIESDLFAFDEWANGDGQLSLCGTWYQYKDNLAGGDMYLGEVVAQFTVKGNELKVTAIQGDNLARVQQELKVLGTVISFDSQDVKTIKIPFNAVFKSYRIHIDQEIPTYFSLFAQELLNFSDMDSPIPLFNNRSIVEIIKDGEIEKVDQWLKEMEYRGNQLIKQKYPNINITADYNHARKELGLPLSPFVTDWKTRKTSVTNCKNPTEKPTRLKEEDISYYQLLGFTPDSAREFFGLDLITFFKEKTIGKSRATELKYESGLSVLVSFLDHANLVSWQGFNKQHAEELISHYFLDNYHVSESGAKSFISVIKGFFKWLDMKKGLQLSKLLAEVITECQASINGSIALLDFAHPYTIRKYHEQLHKAFNKALLDNTERKVEAIFQIENISSTSIQIKDVSKHSNKYTITLPAEICSKLENGMIIIGTIVKGNINIWKIADIDRVYPGQALKYIK